MILKNPFGNNTGGWATMSLNYYGLKLTYKTVFDVKHVTESSRSAWIFNYRLAPLLLFAAIHCSCINECQGHHSSLLCILLQLRASRERDMVDSALANHLEASFIVTILK